MVGPCLMPYEVRGESGDGGHQGKMDKTQASSGQEAVVIAHVLRLIADANDEKGSRYLVGASP